MPPSGPLRQPLESPPSVKDRLMDSLQTWPSPLARRGRTGLEMNPYPPLAGILTPPLKARQPCRACAYQGRLLPPVTVLPTAREVVAQIRGGALTSAAWRQYARGRISPEDFDLVAAG